ncbi:TPA: hypothetical protein ACPVZG_000512 [Vibrio parahaemolyticus]
MRKFKATLSAEFTVDFEDEKKAESFFLEGDWKESFYEFEDLEELVEHLLLNFFNADEKWDTDEGKRYKNVEGMGTYYLFSDTKEWKLIPKEGSELPCGQITLKEIDSLGCEYVNEVHS